MATATTPKINTADPAPDGKTPAQKIYALCRRLNICSFCKQRWCSAGESNCDFCKAISRASNERRDKRKDPKRRKDPNPEMVEIIKAKEANGNGFLLKLASDVGVLLTVRHLQYIDDIDMMKGGKPKLAALRATATPVGGGNGKR